MKYFVTGSLLPKADLGIQICGKVFDCFTELDPAFNVELGRIKFREALATLLDTV